VCAERLPTLELEHGEGGFVAQLPQSGTDDHHPQDPKTTRRAEGTADSLIENELNAHSRKPAPSLGGSSLALDLVRECDQAVRVLSQVTALNAGGGSPFGSRLRCNPREHLKSDG
jgi:hypothetical protein